MKLFLQSFKIYLALLFAICFQSSIAQVTLTATSGTATGTFTTLKLAFDAINAGTHKGDIVIKINANTSESAMAAINASAATSASAPYYTSINIYPTTTGLSISGNLATPLINLNGADNVTIDGRVNATGSTKDLTITNTSALSTAGTSTIRFIGDAYNNTIKYCTLKGSSTDAAAGVVFFSTATTTGNDNNTISNNDITCAADASRPLNAVYALGTTGKNNESNTISNNNIYNFLSKATASQGINISSYNSGYTISGNSFYETASFAPSGAVNYNVILINAATGAGNGFTLSGNYIGGSAALCAGTAWTKTAQNNAFTAVSVTTVTGTANSIQGNTIQNINWTNAGTSSFTGISLAGATVANIGTVTGNTIGAATGTGSITFTSTTTATNFYAINIASTDVVDCQNNTIGSVKVDNAATNATNFFGIVKTAVAGTTTISNNTIGSSTTASSINASSASSGAVQSVYGIQSAGTGVITISGNTVANMVNATSNVTAASAGLISGIYVSAGTNTISNNTVRNLSNANANTSITNTASVSGIVIANATAAAQTVSGNTVFNLSNSYASFAGGVIGIFYSGSTTASAVKANFIHSLSVSALSNTADLYGIKIAAGATTYSNNIISLGGNTTTDLFGIYETGVASNNNNLYFNTINISGSLVTGATNVSYALFSAVNTNTRVFYNNIFVNTRSTVAGASKHFAMYIVTSGGTIVCDNNNYYVSGTGSVLGYNGANKTVLPIVAETSSIITNPVFSNASGTTASSYTPTIAGVALNTTGINVDYAGNIRATNVTMGAYELKGAPDVPTGVVVTAGINTLAIAFTAPTAIGGAAITNYEYSLNNGSTWITPSPATSSPINLTGLTNCTDYDVKIRAVNIIGGGTASAAVTVTPQNGQKAGINWTIGAATNNNWTAVTYGNGLFVAVSQTGIGNRVITSPDGSTWTTRTTLVDNQWFGVTYGNGLFVAVANNGVGNQVMTSPDGTTWTIRTSAANKGWSSVTYGNGLFVAVAADGAVMTSSDGTTWTSRTCPINSWNSVTYGNGLFVAVSYSGTGNRVMTSPDGTTWTSRTSAVDNYWYKVTYGNGLFVAVAITGTGNRVMTSTDGTTWTSRTSAADATWSNVTYANGLFVALSNNPGINQAMTSPDGINWTVRSIPNTAFQCGGIVYGNGVLVAVSVVGGLAMSSVDAFPPSKPTINSTIPRNTYSSIAFTAPTSNGATVITNYEYSTDNGNTWVTPSPAITSSPITIRGLTSGTTYPIQLRAVNSMGAGCGSATMSTTTLIPVVANEPTNVVATAGANGASIAFAAPTNDGGADITAYEYSINDGSSWTAIVSATSPLNISLTACTSYSIKIRAVNIAGSGTASAAVSVIPLAGQRAGTKWTEGTSAADNVWKSVTYSNGLFVAVSNTGTGNRVMTSPDGITWTTRTSAADVSWSSVTYGNGLFVAVASSGTINNQVMTSPDGFTWTLRTSAAAYQWTSVTYGNGLFVAVAMSGGSTNQVMTSPDGITWTIRTSPTYSTWTSVTYGNGLFVAVAMSGTGSRVMTSPDGFTWTNRTQSANNRWQSVTYGNGQFVAVSDDGTNRIMTSTNGFDWTSGTASANIEWNSVIYANSIFVAVANSSNGSSVMTSPDGLTWTSRTTVVSKYLTSVAYGNGKFVAVGILGTGNRVMTSIDLFAPSSPTINSITPRNIYAAVAFTAPASSGYSAITNYEYSINNGSTWITPSSAITTSPFTIRGLTSGTTYPIQLRAVSTTGASCGSATMSTTTLIPVVANDPTNVVATAGVNAATISFITPTNDGGADLSGYEYSINNGSSWTAIASTISPLYISGLTACTNYAIKIRAVNAAGGGTASAAVTVTPQKGVVANTWTARTTPADIAWATVAFGNGLFVALAQSGTANRVMTSPDGINWTSRTSAADNTWTSIIYGNGVFVAVAQSGSGNQVMTSPDGISWTSRTTTANNYWNSVTFGNGIFVAVSSNGTGNRVMTSPDGITWTSRLSAADNGWTSITYGSGLFVAVSQSGTGNRVMTSSDGITWTSRTSAADNYWISVTYGNGKFVAVALTGTGKVMTSPDGITWTIQTANSMSSGACIAYGNGLFAVINQSGQLYTSLDGITWIQKTAPTGNNAQAITFGNGKFVSVAYIGTGNRAMTSDDALAPDIPTINTITPTVTTAAIAFTAPVSYGATAITNYEYSLNNGSTWVTPSPASITSPLTITGLTSGTTYNLQLRAINSVGASCGSVSVNTTTISGCTNPTSGGTIAAAQSGTNPFTPSAFTSSVAASGQTGIVEYKWQSSTTSNSVGFADIPSSNAATYTPGALTVTTWFKRLARVDCSVDWTGAVASNVLEVTVVSCTNPTIGGTIAAAQSGTNSFTPSAFTSSVAASGETGIIEYKWQSSTTSNSTGFADIASSNAATYTSGALTVTTWFKRLARVSCKSDWTGAAESNVLEVTIVTLATQPLAQPTNLYFTNTGASSPYNIVSNFTASTSAAGYIVVRKTGAAPSFVPVDGTSYSVGAQGSDEIVYVGSLTSATDYAATDAVEYNYAIYAYNGSGGAINYLTTSPLTGKAINKSSNSQAIGNTAQSTSAGFPTAGVNVTFPNGTSGSTITASKTNSIPASNFSVLPGVRGVVNQYFTITSSNASPGTYTLILDFSSLGLTNAAWNNFKILKRTNTTAPWVNIIDLGATIANRQTDGIWGKFTITGLSSFSQFTGGAANSTITVMSAVETGTGSLKQALLDATDGDFINFDVSAMGSNTITLTSPIVMNKNITIQGIDGGITLNGNNVSRVMDIADTKVVRLERLKIVNGNGNVGYAGGIWNNGDLTMVNCVVSGNKETGNLGVGGILQFSDTGDDPDDVLNLINCTITANDGTSAVYDDGIGGLSVINGISNIYNTIIYGNTGDGFGDIDQTSTITEIKNSCIGNLSLITITTGIGNIAANPGFVGSIVNATHPYAISNTSPAADAGDNAYSFDATDIRGGAFGRTINKMDGTSGTIDMGAYEFSGCVNPTNGGTIAAAQNGVTPFNPAAFTSSAAASGQSGTVEYKWQSSITNATTGFSEIASSNSDTYDAGALTVTTWYKRLARVSCSADWTGAVESNVIEVTVVSLLPVTGIELSGTASDKQVKLSFKALNEREIGSYTIERSADGTSFTNIGSQQPLNGTQASASYGFVDNQPIVGNNYYRIKGSSINGQLQYSNVVVVKYGVNVPNIVVVPNPIEGKTLKLKVSQLAKGNYYISVTDAIGRSILKKEMLLDGSGSVQITLPTYVKAGNYFLKVNGLGKTFVQLFNVQ